MKIPRTTHLEDVFTYIFMENCSQGLNKPHFGSVENEECGVWKMRGVENAGCGKCGVWKMRSVENEECGKCGVWKMSI